MVGGRLLLSKSSKQLAVLHKAVVLLMFRLDGGGWFQQKPEELLSCWVVFFFDMRHENVVVLLGTTMSMMTYFWEIRHLTWFGWFFWNGMFKGVQMSSLFSGAFDLENSNLAALKTNCDSVSGEFLGAKMFSVHWHFSHHFNTEIHLIHMYTLDPTRYTH